MNQEKIKNAIIGLTRTELIKVLQIAIKDWKEKKQGTERGLCAYFYDKDYKEIKKEEKDYLVFILNLLWSGYAEYNSDLYLWSLVIKRRKKRIEVLEKVLEDVLKSYPEYFYEKHISWRINGVLIFLKRD